MAARIVTEIAIGYDAHRRADENRSLLMDMKTKLQFAAPRAETYQPPKRVLMGPGPSDVSAAVLAAQARATVGHLDPSFGELMEEVKTLLRYAFQTGNELTMPVSAPGSAGMET